MSEISLTKDTDKVLKTIYNEYSNRIKSGISKFDAVTFEENDIERLFPKQDIQYELDELVNNGFIKKWIIPGFELKTNAIIYVENKLPKIVDKTIDTITKFIP